MKFPALPSLVLSILASSIFGTLAEAADAPKPLRALMVTGGCCHDYEQQKKIAPSLF